MLIQDGPLMTGVLSNLGATGVAGHVACPVELPPPSSASPGAHEEGERIFGLLPPAVAQALRDSEAGRLQLQLSASLAGIAWEAAHDGHAFLGEKFTVTRHIVVPDAVETATSAAEPDERCTVSIRCGAAPDAAQSAHASRLQRVVRAHDAFEPTESPRASAGIVHFVGAAAELLDLAAMLEPLPRLLVAEAAVDSAHIAQLCQLAGRRGLSLLLRPWGEDDDTSFMAELYGRMSLGTSVPAALQAARQASLAKGASGLRDNLRTLYCGDERLCMVTAREGNRRQATAMKVDLVQSTALMHQLGTERYFGLLQTYHRLCARLVRAHGGIANAPQGNDGVMCFFGVPAADEHASAQCLRAAMAIVHGVHQLGLEVRIGISTGPVVVDGQTPFGPDVHLADRLQSIAAPGAIVVGETTRQLTKARFAFDAVNVGELKGFAGHQVVAHALVRELPEFDLEPLGPNTGLSPFVGRDDEVAELQRAWRLVGSTDGVPLLISGEAGIGKSRLVREFRRWLSDQGVRCVELRCSPRHANSAFHPLIGWLQRQFGTPHDPSSSKALVDVISRSEVGQLPIPDAARVVAALLSPSADGNVAELPQSAERRRQLTLDVLAAWLARRAASPVCLVVEDVQWIDPSTQEFIDRIAALVRRLPLMLLLTRRSDVRPALPRAFECTELSLRGLSKSAAALLVEGNCGPGGLPPDSVRVLADRADGVPLFLEESTRMAVERSAGDRRPEALSSILQEVPSTIQDLLMARLDRHASAKRLAQVGAVIGREFPAPLLEAVLRHESAVSGPADMHARLKSLTESGLIVAKDSAGSVTYWFKHALVRDAAYQSLLERDRKRLHFALVQVVQQGFSDLQDAQPEMLAYHCTEAGLAAEALTHWEQAARRATARSAHREAIAHLHAGLALLDQLPESIPRDRTELRLQLLLAARLIATQGYGAADVERVYARAQTLCRRMGDEEALMKVQLGLEGCHFMRADFDKAHAIAQETSVLADRSRDPMRKIQAAWAVANVLFHRGEVLEAVEHMDACLHAYDLMAHRPSAVQDPGVMCLCYSAWGKWELGFPDEALRRAQRVVTLAEQLDHRFSMGEAWGFITTVHHFRGETMDAMRCANRAIEICEEGGFAVWLAHARVMRGRLAVQLAKSPAEIEQGLDEMKQAHAAWASTGAVVTQAFYLAMQAEGLSIAGRPAEGLAALQTAFDIVQRVGERYYEPEIRRLMGELILQSDASRTTEAQAWFESALVLSRSAKLHGLSLRAASSLAQLWARESREEEAHRLLASVRATFTEGMATRDLRQVNHWMDAWSVSADYGAGV
jgi:class 3 adenylate cyclase/predicted ATPase